MKTIHFTLITFFLLSYHLVFSQQNNVGINTTNPDPSAALEVISKNNNQGILIPKLTNTQRQGISNPATGLLVYETTSNSFWYFDGMDWIDINAVIPNSIQDEDMDTAVEISEGPGSTPDAIEMKLDGNVQWKFIDDRLEADNINGNLFVGQNAGKDNSSGSGNTYLGNGSGFKNTDGVSNTFIGNNSGFENTSGGANVFVGQNAGKENISGSRNSFLGRYAGGDNTTGSDNVLLGYNAGEDIATGSHNIILGSSTVMGADVSQKLIIEGGNQPGLPTTPLIYGEFDNDLLRVNGTLNINNAFSFPITDGTANQILSTDGSGTLTWVTPSSGGTPTKIEDVDMDTAVEAIDGSGNTDQINFTVNGITEWTIKENRIESNTANIFIGKNAGSSLTTGFDNMTLGNSAGKDLTTGANNTLIGNSAGTKITEGYNNTLLGNIAGNDITTGTHNVLAGVNAGGNLMDQDFNVMIGTFAGLNNQGDRNIFLGHMAGENELGSDKLYIENSDSSTPLIYGEFNNDLLRVNGTLNINNAFSFPTTDGTANQILATDGNGNLSWTTANGGGGGGSISKIEDADMDTWVETVDEIGAPDFIQFVLDGDSHWRIEQDRIEEENSDGNIFIGQEAGISNTANPTIGEGVNNTFMGTTAGLSNSTGGSNTFIGHSAGTGSSTGRDNTFLGNEAGSGNTSGNFNTLIGKSAGASNGSGTKNSIVGGDAAIMLAGGQENVVLGFAAANSMAAGSRNVFIGQGSALSLPSGSDNIFIGNTAGALINSSTDNTLIIENSSASIPLIWGDFANDRLGINRQAVTNTLEVEGDASKTTAGSWTGNSDARLKKNIENLDSEEILQKLLQLQGVNYEWNDDKTGTKRPTGKQYGFIAQNIQEVFPSLVQEDNLGYLQTAYGTYDAMQIEALRALLNRIEKLENENALLKTQVSEIEYIKNEIAELKGIAKK